MCVCVSCVRVRVSDIRLCGVAAVALCVYQHVLLNRRAVTAVHSQGMVQPHAARRTEGISASIACQIVDKHRRSLPRMEV